MMNYEVLLTGIVGLITTITSGWVSWFFARKKYNSEVDSQLISNMKESLEFYKSLSDDNKERLSQVLEQNSQLLEQNAILETQVKALEAQVKSLKEQVDTLTKRMADVTITPKVANKTKKEKK